MGGGLNHFDPVSGTFTRYSKKNGLPDDLVLGILKDDEGNLWISTSNGLCRFDPSALTFHTYDRFDGLPSNDFNQDAYFQSSDGEMYFGSSNAVVAFRPTTSTTIPICRPLC